MTLRNERRRQFMKQQAAAILAVISPQHQNQQQMRERAATLARHGNSDQQIARELEVSTEIVRRWISEGTAG